MIDWRAMGVIWAAVFVAVAATLFAPAVLSDPDTYWHVAAGQWMLDNRQVVGEDVFSHTVAGQTWRTHEWFSEVLMALAYSLGGWSGVLTLTALASGATVLILGRRVGRNLSGISLALFLLLAMACIGPSLLARPHILVLPIVAVWTALLLAARDRSRPPQLAWALIVTLWANMHGSYLLAFVLAGAFGLEALIEAGPGTRWRVIRRWGLFGMASVGAALITPHGLAAITHPLDLMRMTILPGITEWRASDFSTLTPLEIGLLAVMFVGFYRGVKIPPVRLLLLLFILHMALQHTRHVMILAVVAPMILAEPFAHSLGQTRVRLHSRRLWYGYAAIVLVLCGVRLALPVQRTDGPESPISAVASVPASVRSQPVLNEYGFGGYLIFDGEKPYIDGRADMYGDDFVSEYFAMSTGDEERLDAAMETYGIRWTLLPPDHPLTKLMDERPGWTRTYEDDFAVVHQPAP